MINDVFIFLVENYNKINYEIFNKLHNSPVYKQLKNSGFKTKEADIMTLAFNICMFSMIMNNEN